MDILSFFKFRSIKNFLKKYWPILIGVAIGLIFGETLFGGFFYDIGRKFGEWFGNLIF
tara:strand:- start:274 stop:447 length:174 start_codon:yes stop_codon:yes gene_type:complete